MVSLRSQMALFWISKGQVPEILEHPGPREAPGRPQGVSRRPQEARQCVHVRYEHRQGPPLPSTVPLNRFPLLLSVRIHEGGVLSHTFKDVVLRTIWRLT